MKEMLKRLNLKSLLYAGMILFTSQGSIAEESQISSSLIFMIHGDASYRYHLNGESFEADNETLEMAKKVATQCQSCEVFIFIQDRSHGFPRNLIPLISKKHAKAIYYSNGQKIKEESFYPNRTDNTYGFELNFLRERSQATSETLRFFNYYGHHIPEHDVLGYSRSFDEVKFTVDEFTLGLEAFKEATGGSPFDALVLNSCYGATPGTLSMLAPHAQTVIASPNNLHLSYFSLEPYLQIDKVYREELPTFIKAYASYAFLALSSTTHNEIQIGIYDTQMIEEFLENSIGEYQQLVNQISSIGFFLKYGNCNELETFPSEGSENGVTLFHRPHKFFPPNVEPLGWACPIN